RLPHSWLILDPLSTSSTLVLPSFASSIGCCLCGEFFLPLLHWQVWRNCSGRVRLGVYEFIHHAKSRGYCYCQRSAYPFCAVMREGERLYGAGTGSSCW